MGRSSRGDVTRLLLAWRDGDPSAADRLVPLVYDELHAIAGRYLRNEGNAGTLQTTALIHEAYLRLVGSDVEWEGRSHFFAIAANTMRRVLVDHARARRRLKRGGPDGVQVTLDDPVVDPGDGDDTDPVDVIAVDRALDELAELDGRKARAVELHYFGGLGYEQMAEVMEISTATVHRDLRFARSWIHDRLRPGDGEGT
jgi:RNA polymerase sigma factor (TIGR02999 family)